MLCELQVRTSDRRCVRVSHGRGSYELGVEIRRWIDVDGVSRGQVFPLRDVIGLRTDPGVVGYGGTTVTSAELVRRFVAQLAGWNREGAVAFAVTAFEQRDYQHENSSPSPRSPGLGRPGESHPRAPLERSVTVSCHSARAVLIIKGCLTHAQWAK